MRILTWNVNVLRTCLDYHPFSSMPKKNVEGLLDELHAEIFCFQEHKTRRAQLERSMACPGPYDGFWTFPRSKTGYSGVCTFVDSRYCVPMKAEEGVSGMLLDDKQSTMRPPWTPEERIGHYPEMDEVDWTDEIDGTAFDPKRLDLEGRAVVCDFGLFILFNLYCPNETNDARRPFKMNFLKALQERVKLLQAAGREVILAGDMNVMRAPIDSGEGGIKTSAAQHYEHPARGMMDEWCAPKGPMVDVVRESWPDREDMFTCWNTKLDARSANYGSRIDMILCTPGLRPWIKGGDIQAKVFGSDHCPVYIDLHESITLPDGTVQHLKDMLNPPDRTPSTAPVYPNDAPRHGPEPPRFATKFLEEFSARQTTLKSFFGGRKGSGPVKKLVEPSPSPGPSSLEDDAHVAPEPAVTPTDEPSSTPFSVARAAFDSIDAQLAQSSSKTPHSNQPSVQANGKTSSPSAPIDMTEDEETIPQAGRSQTQGKSARSSYRAPNGQTKLSSFFAQPTPPPTAERRSSSPPLKRRSSSSRNQVCATDEGQTSGFPDLLPPPANLNDEPQTTRTTIAEDEALIAQAIAEADEEKAAKRAKTNAQAAPVWSNLFAKKLPPLCTVHQKPCRDYIVKIPGPNKGKRFWLCSLPVGAGYDKGRSKRPREDVNPEFRCDFFLWDSANPRKEKPTTSKG